MNREKRAKGVAPLEGAWLVHKGLRGIGERMNQRDKDKRGEGRKQKNMLACSASAGFAVVFVYFRT